MTRNISVINAFGVLVGTLNGVDTRAATLTERVFSYDDIRFSVSKYVGDQKSNCYDYLKNNIYLYVDDIGYFRIYDVRTHGDGIQESKQVSAYSWECELGDRCFEIFKINTGETDSFEYYATDNIDSTTGIPKKFIRFYDPDNQDLSLLNLVIKEKAPGWSIGYVDPSLAGKKGSFSLANAYPYTILTGTIAPFFKCIFTFDRFARKINAYSFDQLDKTGDTNIYISYRNFLNELDIQKSNDGLTTMLSVTGGEDLDIRQVNFGSNELEYCWYLLNDTTDDGEYIYANKALAEKYKAWFDYREELRKSYVAEMANWTDINDRITKLKIRTPVDAIDTSQYAGMTLDGLEIMKESCVHASNILAYSYAALDDEGNPRVDDDGLIVLDPEKEQEFIQTDPYRDYKTYVDYIIPNLNVAISNKKEGKSDPYDQDWEKDWSLYGITELEGKIKALESAIAPLVEAGYTVPWDELPEEEKISYVKGKDVWDGYYNTYAAKVSDRDAAKAHLDELKTELADLETALDASQERLNTLANDAKKENYTADPFTKDELACLDRLIYQAQYSNPNVITNTYYTAEQAIDRREELYQLALDELYVQSQHQYSFSCSLEDLMSFTPHQYAKVTAASGRPVVSHISGADLDTTDFRLLRFIRLGITDDYYVKMRIKAMTYNPLDTADNSLSVEFSNFLQGRDSYSDVADIFTSLSSQIQRQVTGTVDTKISDAVSVALSTSVLEALANSALSSLARSAVTDAIMADDGAFSTLTSRYITADEVSASVANISTLNADSLFAKYLHANFAQLDLANIEAGCITQAMIGDGVIGTAQIADSSITDAKIVALSASKLTAGTIDAREIDVTNLRAENITVGKINGTQIDNRTITKNNLAQAVIDDINSAKDAASQAQRAANGKNTVYYSETAPTGQKYILNDLWFDIGNDNRPHYWDGANWIPAVFGNDALGNINANKITAGSIDAARMTTNVISAINADITTATILEAKIPNLSASKITTGTLDADRIGAGTITAEKLTIGNGENFYTTGYDTFDQIPVGNTGLFYEISRSLTASVVDDVSFEGSRCLKITSNAGSGITGAVYLGDPDAGYGYIPVIVGKTYIISAWTKSDQDAIGRIWVRCNAAKSKDGYYSFGGKDFTASTEWKRAYMTYTVPEASDPNAKNVYICLGFGLKTGSATLYVDAIQIETGTSRQTPSEFSAAGAVVIDGGNIVANSITAKQIAARSITGNEILANSITASELNVAKLSAISANMGDITGGSLDINGKFIVTSTGALTATGADISGKITSSSGEIGGFTIGEKALYSGKSSLDSDAAGVYVGTDGISAGSNFKVTESGTITAKDADITGKITSSSGQIGGFTIGTSALYSGKSSIDSDAAGVYLGTDGLNVGNNFKVTASGVVTAKEADIAGKITSTSGSIGGFVIEDGKLYNGKRTLSAKTEGVYIGTDGIGLGTDFSVTNDGSLKATDAEISGTLTAGAGSKIGGFTISDKDIFKGTFGFPNSVFLSTGKSSLVSIGGSTGAQTWGIALGDGFGVTTGGALYANNASISGKLTAQDNSVLGGWTITGDSIRSIWSPVAGSTDVYQVVLKSTPNDDYASIFIKRRDESGNETYPFEIMSNGSVKSLNPQFRFGVGDDASTVTMRRSGSDGAHDLSLVYNNGSADTFYALINKDGVFLPPKALSITVNRGTLNRNKSFYVGNLVGINILLDGVTMDANTNYTLATLPASVLPKANMILSGLATTGCIPLNVWVKVSGNTASIEAKSATAITNASVVVNGVYSTAI